MPVDVACTSNARFFQKKMNYNHHNLEEMNGYMTLIGPGNHKQSVQVKVYRTSLEHFAAIYPQKKVCLPLGVINLKNTCVQKLQNEDGFIVRERGLDTSMCLKFICEAPRELDSWLMAFTSLSSPTLQQSSLPSVMEDEES